jgi:flagellar motor switch protein FliN/FliY
MPDNPSVDLSSDLSEQDAMAAEWAAALEEKPAAEPGYGTPAPFADFDSGAREGGGAAGLSGGKDLNLILDIPVQLTVELGRTRIPIKNILHLAQGSVVELDTVAGEPMDVLVNGYLIAQGEVVVVNEKFGVRLTDIVTPSERMRRLSRGG